MTALTESLRVAETAEGFTVLHVPDVGEFYVCEMVGTMPVPLKGPYPSVEAAHEASRLHGSQKDLSVAGMAALQSMIKRGTWKFEEGTRVPKKRRKW